MDDLWWVSYPYYIEPPADSRKKSHLQGLRTTTFSKMAALKLNILLFIDTFVVELQIWCQTYVFGVKEFIEHVFDTLVRTRRAEWRRKTPFSKMAALQISI